jgi:hypothetical protein
MRRQPGLGGRVGDRVAAGGDDFEGSDDSSGPTIREPIDEPVARRLPVERLLREEVGALGSAFDGRGVASRPTVLRGVDLSRLARRRLDLLAPIQRRAARTLLG